jgi:hypothetical protein
MPFLFAKSLNFHVSKGRFLLQTLGLGLIFWASGVRSVETGPMPTPEPPLESQVCESKILRQAKLLFKGIRDRASWGVPHRDLILAGNAQEFLGAVWESHDNRNFEIESPYQNLRGVDADRQAQIQQLAAENNNPLVTSYFRAYERTERATGPTLDSLWNRKPDKDGDADWIKAVTTLEEWVEVYTEYEDLLNKTVTEGFEAQRHALVRLFWPNAFADSRREISFWIPSKKRASR